MSELSEAARRYSTMLRALRRDRAVAPPAHPLHAAVHRAVHGTSTAPDPRLLELVASAPRPTVSDAARLAELLFRSRAAGQFQSVADVIALQQSAGGFLLFTPDDNAELYWYGELVLLHAISAAIIRDSRHDLFDVIIRATDFCMREIQPDHATARPFAVHAFVMNPATRHMADWIMHTFEQQFVDGADDISLLLLDDSIYCLDRLAGDSNGLERFP